MTIFYILKSTKISNKGVSLASQKLMCIDGLSGR